MPTDRTNSLDPIGQRSADQETRHAKIRTAVQQAAELAVLSVTAGDIEEVMMRHGAVGMSIPELRYAVTLVHNVTITLPELPQENTP